MDGRYPRGDQTLVREINLSTVLRHLHQQSPLSRAGLAQRSGLNKTTVSSLIEELLDRGLVREVGLDNSGAGRPATLLDLNPRAGCVIGVALGVDFVLAILCDFVGQVLWRRLVETDPRQGQQAMLDLTLRTVDEATAASQSLDLQLLGLGLAVPGTVNLQDGVLIFSPNLQWRQVPLRRIFAAHSGLPVFVDNDANAAALAEHLFGVARQAQHFVSIFCGVGVGGGLFLNGQLYRGAHGFAGEIGHTNFLVEHLRRPCRCGSRGCWETSVAQDAVLERVRSRLAVGRDSLIPQLMAEQRSPLTLSLVIEAAEAGDTQAIEALAETGSLLGLGVANLISLFNPEMIVLGGPLSAAAPFLLPAIEEAAGNTVIPDIFEQVEILVSAFGPDASVMGAAALVVEALLSNPTRVDRTSSRTAPQAERR